MEALLSNFYRQVSCLSFLFSVGDLLLYTLNISFSSLLSKNPYQILQIKVAISAGPY